MCIMYAILSQTAFYFPLFEFVIKSGKHASSREILLILILFNKGLFTISYIASFCHKNITDKKERPISYKLTCRKISGINFLFAFLQTNPVSSDSVVFLGW